MLIAVTGAGALLGQGIIRSLLESSLQPRILALDPSPLAAGLYWTPHRRTIPLAKSPKYVEAIAEILRTERPDALLIGTDVELLVLAEARQELERAFPTKVIVSKPDVIRIADDKYLTFRFMKDHGFDAPESCLPGAEVELAERIGFPLIVKPRVGARSVGVKRVEGLLELQMAVAADPGCVIQECVATDDDEYTAGSLSFDGTCRATIVMRRNLRDGNTYRAYVEDFPELRERVSRMAAALGAHGPANFQFRLAGGTLKVFEINARFSGTTPLRMRAGFNEVEVVLRHVLLGEAVLQPQIHPMTILRHLTETVVLPSEVVTS